MKVLAISKEAIAEALQVLKQGGVVAHATETCYGLACDLTNPQAVQRLFVLKQRLLNQPVSALFPSIDEAKRYVEWNERAKELARKFLPGPLTLILLSRRETPHTLFPIPEGAATVGVRVSSHPIAQKLAQCFGKPLSTTSANIHGKPPPYSTEEILSQLSPDLVLDSGPLPEAPPSTVVDLTKGSQKILRQGPLHLSTVRSARALPAL